MLKSLPDDIIMSVFNFLDSYDLISFLVLSKYFHNNQFKKTFEAKINNEKEKFLRIKKMYHQNIIDIMGGVKYMAKLPYLEWKKNYLGITGYIDNIKPDDLSHPVMLGFDEIFDRPFIVFCTVDKNSYFTEPKPELTTIFQRYTNDNGTWAHADYNGRGFIKEMCYLMKRGKIIHCLIAFNICNLLNNNGFIIEYGSMINKEARTNVDNLHELYEVVKREEIYLY